MDNSRLLQKAIEVTLMAMFLAGCIVPMKSTSTPSTAIDTIQPLANTPAPELPPETAMPPPATAKPSYDGEWQGTTSQGKEIAFTIRDNGIIAMSVDFSFDFTACGVSSISGPTSFWQQSPKASIMEDAFSVAVSERTTVTGLLSSATAATGNLVVTVNDLGCKGINEATWTATKLVSAMPTSTVPIARLIPSEYSKNSLCDHFQKNV